MKQKLMTIFSRTPVSVGAGATVGAIDLPVMRERHTRIPIIPGSSVKGVLRDLWKDSDAEQKRIFGEQTKSGQLFVGEARVLAFPVRSARGMFAWVTSPLALERFKRDKGEVFGGLILKGMECCASPALNCRDNQVVLEEYCFVNDPSKMPDGLAEELKDLSGDAVWRTVGSRLAVISDEMFSYFVENACEIPTRIQIDDETGVVKGTALFCQEQVPSETMFYNVLAAQDGDEEVLAEVCRKLSEVKVLQFGGDETIGLGYCTVEIR